MRDLFKIFIMKYLYITILVALSLSCNSNKKSDSLSILNINYKKIIIDYNEAVAILNLDNIVDTLNFIPLEKTKPYVGNIKKLIIYHDNFIIWDSKGKTVWVFDSKGKFKTRINKLGKGADEYIEITNISVNKRGDIQIVDASRKSIVSYSLNGTFLKRKSLKSFPSDYIENGEYSYIFYHHIPNKSKKSNYVQVYKDNRNLSGYFPFIHTWQFEKDRFLKPNNNLYFYRSYDNNIYSLKDEKLQIEYILDFGKFNSINTALRECQNLQEFYEIRNKKTYVGNISSLTISDKHLAFRYDVVKNGNVTNHNYIYDLNNDVTYNYIGATTQKFKIPPSLPTTFDNGLCYSYIEAWQLSDDLKETFSLKYKTKLTTSSNPIIMQFEYDF